MPEVVVYKHKIIHLSILIENVYYVDPTIQVKKNWKKKTFNKNK